MTEQPPSAEKQWFVDPPRGSAKPTCTFDNEEAARRYADECPPHTRIVERPAPPQGVSAPVFLGHMLGQVHGVTWTTNAQVEKDKALAAQIFGGQPEDLWIGECHGQDWCLWVLAIQVVVGLMRGPKWRGVKLWHVYSAPARHIQEL